MCFLLLSFFYFWGQFWGQFFPCTYIPVCDLICPYIRLHPLIYKGFRSSIFPVIPPYNSM